MCLECLHTLFGEATIKISKINNTYFSMLESS
jgi:hypothetical protein